MKVFLVFPPHWLPVMPHLALPTLTAHLRAHGHEVIQRDLNFEVFDTLLSPEHLTRCAPQSAPGQETIASPRGSQTTRLVERVASAKATMRDARFYDGRTSLQAFQTLNASLAVASAPFHPDAFEFTRFVSSVPVDSSKALLRAVADPQRNFFHSLFAEGIVRDIVEEQPDLIGISIPTLDQMLAGMTLAYLIKQVGVSSHIVVGGPHISMLREQLPKTPALFDLFDSALVFEAEGALLRLTEVLDEGRDLAGVPNLIWRHKGEVRSTPSRILPVPDLLPDFDGLPLDRYLAPDLVLPLLSSHGCYHGKCAFCNVGYGGPCEFRMVDPDLVVEHMRELKARYGARHIFFADEALTPKTLHVLSTQLAEGRDDIHWCGCVRFDHALSRDLLESMARGGCRMLLFGLETAAESTIQRMHKGTRLEVMSRILRDSARAGIWNHTFFFFGFPGETMEAAQETVNFVYAHQDAIHSGSPGAFLLERYAPAQRSPEDYGITHIVEAPDHDLAIYFDYAVASGLDEAMADQLATRLIDVLPQRPFGQFYVADAYRLLYASRLWDRGQPMPLWLA